MDKSTKNGLLIALVGLAAFAFPAAVTLSSIRQPGTLQLGPNPSPLGYTISLLLFFVPDLIIMWWIVRHPHTPIERRAFLATICSIFTTGCILDLFFASAFFEYPNAGATLGIRLPAFSFTNGWEAGICPLEEFAFYFLGGIFMTGIYVWMDREWLDRGRRQGPESTALTLLRERRPIYHFHWISIGSGVGLILVAIGCRGLIQSQPGFPGYFIFLVLIGLVPTSIIYPTVKESLNWQAFAVMFLSLQLVSLLWEATLAVPYNWWNYRHDQMLGIYIGAWANLPIESVLMWIFAGWSTVMTFEFFRVLFHRRILLQNMKLE